MRQDVSLIVAVYLFPRRSCWIPSRKALLPPQLEENTWQTVAQALLEKKALDVTYLSRSREVRKIFTLHPQGLVSRHSVTNLLATVNDYDDIRQFALQRIEAVAFSNNAWHESEDFDLDDYISSGAFGYPQSTDNIWLVAHVKPQVAWLLTETPLAERQTLVPLPGTDWQRLEAEVTDDQQTVWWLRGMDASVEVIEPQAWHDDIRTNAEKILPRFNKEPAGA
ncbi:helix-turn-helix transcriptional regulator [Pistricoccus aurantiacus]|uniref:helix-turn-helix transcriptional regulator n=1 Tax=Pistricoccus aurantiacus TaxID=1883414 RepID=UPI0036316DD4